ncbi:MAG: virulence protein SciE type, partial [Acidobacteria bacterium]|nr:virulence protein SciE type [Acidobacteriota bacterium]
MAATFMTAKDLFQAGRLDEAVRALGAELRNDPTDQKRRTFLFELLCFSGEYDRAEKQLDILAGVSKEAGMGALVYRAALHAERTRRRMFETGNLPIGEARTAGGTIDGKPFGSIEDADPRIGPRLEVFAAGAYLWLPFEHIASVEIQPPQRLRDLIWIPAIIRPGPAFQGRELGEVLLPVLA